MLLNCIGGDDVWENIGQKPGKWKLTSQWKYSKEDEDKQKNTRLDIIKAVSVKDIELLLVKVTQQFPTEVDLKAACNEWVVY